MFQLLIGLLLFLALLFFAFTFPQKLHFNLSYFEILADDFALLFHECRMSLPIVSLLQ